MLAQETHSISSTNVRMDASARRSARLSRHAFVLATDGQSSANGAARVARLLAEREGVPLHIVGVVDGFLRPRRCLPTRG